MFVSPSSTFHARRWVPSRFTTRPLHVFIAEEDQGWSMKPSPSGECVLSFHSTFRASCTIEPKVDGQLPQCPALPDDVLRLVHGKVVKMLATQEVIAQYGLYIADASWCNDWVRRLKATDKSEVGVVGARVYGSKVRSRALQRRIHEVFVRHFQLPQEVVQPTQDPMAAVQPFAVTRRVARLWHQVTWSLRVEQPVLVVGNDGCGKSEALRALAWLRGQDVRGIVITPETEPAALVGQYCPSERKGERIVWQDGLVTQAISGVRRARLGFLPRSGPPATFSCRWLSGSCSTQRVKRCEGRMALWQPQRHALGTSMPSPALGQGCIRRGGTSAADPEAVRQAVGGGCQSGWGRLLSVTNAVEAGTCRQRDSGWAKAGHPGRGGGLPPPLYVTKGVPPPLSNSSLPWRV